jgi:hypothetical protein
VSLREKMNKNKNISVGITILIILAALVFIYYQIKGDSIPQAPPQMAYYTTDDGKTFFAEDQMHETPFTHDGAQAVRAWRYTCGDSKEAKLGYLERYTADFLKQLAQAKAANQPMDPMIIVEQGDAIYEVKKPGNPTWYKKASQTGQNIINPKCPAGQNPMWMTPAPGSKPGDKLS